MGLFKVKFLVDKNVRGSNDKRTYSIIIVAESISQAINYFQEWWNVHRGEGELTRILSCSSLNHHGVVGLISNNKYNIRGDQNIMLNNNTMDNLICVGEIFSFKGYNWISLDKTDEGGILAIMTDCWDTFPFDSSNGVTNNYKESTLRKKLLAELLPELGEKNLLTHTVDLVADNGDDSYGTVNDKVFVISCDEYRKYRKHIPEYDESIWTCTPWYINPSTGGGSYVRYVDPAGYLSNYSNYAYNSYGVVPACVLDPERLKVERRITRVVEI